MNPLTTLAAPVLAVPYYARRNPDAALVLAGVTVAGVVGVGVWYWWSHRDKGLTSDDVRTIMEDWFDNQQFSESRFKILSVTKTKDGDHVVDFQIGAERAPAAVVTADGEVEWSPGA